MKINKLFLAVIGAAFAVSCSNSDDNGSTSLGNYDNGILVLNEGNGTSGSVTYASSDLTTVEQDIFNNVNSGQSLGGYDQSMFFDGDRAFIIAGGSNKITVVNRYTFEYINTISTGLANPRYGVAYNGKAYVTNLNDFTSATDDYVAVIDLSTLAVGSPIAVNDYADHIVETNGKLYVADGSFGSGSHVTVIDPATAAIKTSIDVGISPNSMEVKDGILYVLCANSTDNSKMVRIYTEEDTTTTDIEEDTIESSVTFAGELTDARNLDIDNNRAYFTVGPKIYRIALNAVAANDTPLIDTGSTSLYIGYGFAVHGNRIFISEAASDFVSDGKMLVYSANGGDVLKEITVGLGPNSFYFNE